MPGWGCLVPSGMMAVPLVTAARSLWWLCLWSQQLEAFGGCAFGHSLWCLWSQPLVPLVTAFGAFGHSLWWLCLWSQPLVAAPLVTAAR